jgi:hypothetical protein
MFYRLVFFCAAGFLFLMTFRCNAVLSSATSCEVGPPKRTHLECANLHNSIFRVCRVGGYLRCFCYCDRIISLVRLGKANPTPGQFDILRQMTIPHAAALDALERTATQQCSNFSQDGDSIPISLAVGRICRKSYYSPVSTPAFETSAMDGFAVSSPSTIKASPSNAIILCVKGTMAAGDAPRQFPSDPSDGCPPCVEIMTGA